MGIRKSLASTGRTINWLQAFKPGWDYVCHCSCDPSPKQTPEEAWVHPAESVNMGKLPLAWELTEPRPANDLLIPVIYICYAKC